MQRRYLRAGYRQHDLVVQNLLRVPGGSEEDQHVDSIVQLPVSSGSAAAAAVTAPAVVDYFCWISSGLRGGLL